MKTFLTLILSVWWVNSMSAEEAARVPRPRLRLDPVTRTAVAERAVKVAEGAAQAWNAASGAKGSTEAGDGSPILMGTYGVKDRATGWFEAPKQETFEGRFTPWKGGKLKEGKRGGALRGGLLAVAGVGQSRVDGDARGRAAAERGFAAGEVVRGAERISSREGRNPRAEMGAKKHGQAGRATGGGPGGVTGWGAALLSCGRRGRWFRRA